MMSRYFLARQRALELYPDMTAAARKRWAVARADIDARFPRPVVDIGKYGQPIKRRPDREPFWLRHLPALTVGGCVLYALIALWVAP